jgi:hypothetical protein
MFAPSEMSLSSDKRRFRIWKTPLNKINRILNTIVFIFNERASAQHPAALSKAFHDYATP